MLPGSGFPIGIIPLAEYETHSVTLSAGQRVVMFSDGVMEVFMPGSNLTQKEEGLLGAVRASKGDISALLRTCAITTKTNSAQPDDITILVIGHETIEQ